jgi:hypothetical protein
MVGVNTDDVELTEWILIYEVVMNLGPAETNYFAILDAEKESSGIKPGLLHSVFEICHRPVALVRVDCKDFIVELKPFFAMYFGIKGNKFVWVGDM